MDKVFVSKCESCGSKGRVFPDQIKVIKDSSWSPFRPLLPCSVGGKWICIACNSRSCRIIGYENEERAHKLQKIRDRGHDTNTQRLNDLRDGKA